VGKGSNELLYHTQGGCGNCWAFSAAGAIEGQLAKILGWLPDVSVQEVTDCCKSGSKYSNLEKFTTLSTLSKR